MLWFVEAEVLVVASAAAHGTALANLQMRLEAVLVAEALRMASVMAAVVVSAVASEVEEVVSVRLKEMDLAADLAMINRMVLEEAADSAAKVLVVDLVGIITMMAGERVQVGQFTTVVLYSE